MANLNVLPSWSVGVSTGIAPTRNGLLASLPVESYRRLLPDLEPLELVAESMVYDVGDSEGYLYFIISGIVARFLVTKSGKLVAFAVSGNEGVVGIASFLGGHSTLSRAVVVSPGHAYRLPGALLTEEVRHNSLLLQLLLRYTHALFVQTGLVAACNRHHTVEQQLCRWILSCMDRSPLNELCLTQQLIATMLGVRRESVTAAAGKLHAESLINYRRGHITVLDRAQLEQRVCECYAVVKKESARLLPPEKLTHQSPIWATDGALKNDAPRASPLARTFHCEY